MKIELWSDGSASGNPGPSGWACILLAPDHGKRKEISGGAALATNNSMELIAVIEGLKALTRPAEVSVHLDSAYVMNAIEKGWVKNWQQNGWKTKAGGDVANKGLWEEMIIQLARHEVSFVKVKGHSGVALNEEVDQLAVEACRSFGGKQK